MFFIGGYRNRPRKAKENRTRYSDDGDVSCI